MYHRGKTHQSHQRFEGPTSHPTPHNTMSAYNYNSTAAYVVGGHRGRYEARCSQQEELNIKAAENALKQEKKKQEKSRKKIEKWEFMQGRGPGHFLGGTEDNNNGDMETQKAKAMQAAREKMQADLNARTANTSTVQTDGDQKPDKLALEREEAKRKKKIADWERLHGPLEGGGRKLGQRLEQQQNLTTGNQRGPGQACSGGSGTSGMPADQAACQTARATKTSAESFREGAAATSPPEKEAEDDGWEIAEEVKRSAMRAARLRMQQMHDQKIAQQSQKEAEKQGNEIAPFKRLAARFDNLNK